MTHQRPCQTGFRVMVMSVSAALLALTGTLQAQEALPGAAAGPNASRLDAPKPATAQKAAPAAAAVSSTPGASSTAHAAPEPSEKIIITAPEHKSCPTVMVGGRQVQDFACLSALLSAAPADPALPVLSSAQIAQRPSSALGLANPSVTHQWLGTNFGKSTIPARPAPAPVTLPPALGHP